MATFGKITDGASSTSSSVDKKAASLAAPLTSGTVDSMSFRAWISGAGSCDVRGFIYSDNAGAPDVLLAVTDTLQITNTAEQLHTVNFSGANRISVVPANYWVGFHWQDPGSISFVYSRDGTANGRVEGTEAWADGTANPFGTVTSGLAGPIDCYVTYTEATFIPKVMMF